MRKLFATFAVAGALGLAIPALTSLPAAAGSSVASAGNVCLRSDSTQQELCVPASPGLTAVRMTVSSARNLSPYAVRLEPAEGISLECLAPGTSVGYPQGKSIVGVRVFSGATCAV
ncbi:hypothetical protein [Nonomuraea sp. NPDC005650]|uniref:hypothetical protein n=1 Tax=Nonomuraea sp. NPDC005650 TaxID=3157045 RepID=UPI0033BC4A1D